MSRHPVALLLVLVLSALPLGAQAARQGAAASAAPGEPEIVMPQVILQIEDLSVEKVVAQLPPEEELLPPARPIPVLSEGDLVVGDPTIPEAGALSDVTIAPQRDRLLASDITLGTGLQNRIIGIISLKTLGADPRFDLQFNHETVDGYWLRAPGSGFNRRNDLLQGSLKFGAGGLDVSLGGTFSESEDGLQGRSPYGARLARSVSGSADLNAGPLDWLSLGVGADVSTDTLTLEATSPLNPLQRGDFLFSPRLSLQARFGAVALGLNSSYTYRSDSGIAGSGLQRFSVVTSFNADLPATFILSGDVGWFVNSETPPLSLFPFSLSLTGTPWEFITLSVGGGYSVQPYNLHDVVTSHELSYPGALLDDHGWFGTSSVQLTLSRDLSATLALSFMASSELPTGVPTGTATQDAGTGLFLVSQGPAPRLSADGGLRWGISSAFSISAGWHHEFLARPFFTPQDSLKAGIVGVEPAGRFGGSLSMSVAPTPDNQYQQPVLRMSGFWKPTDAVKLQLDGDDLLLPLLGGTRPDIGPFESPGFRVTGSLEISL